MANKTEILRLLEEAKDLIYQSVNSLTEAKDLMKEESYGYNIVGNMEGYVTGYLTEGVDCIVDKIDEYIKDTNELDDDEDEDDEEDDDDGVNDLERDAFFKREQDEADMPGGFN